MLKVHERIEDAEDTSLILSLPFEMRQKSRLRATLNDGREVGLVLPRGGLLRGGDCLRAEDGSVIRVEAASEAVSTASHADPLVIARACYHLGNRHVPLQIGDSWVRYQHDHVLDGMVEGLGLQVVFEQAPFEPEGGAYGPGHHGAEKAINVHGHKHGHHH